MNSLEIKDVLGVAEPATKVIEIISNAIGTLYEPRKIRKRADAEAYRIKKITTAAKESNFNGNIELFDGKITISGNDNNLEEIKAIISSEVRRLYNEKENIMKIADYAYDELENDKSIIKEEIDNDWIKNFLDTGRKIYRDDLQFIFGKILAGEIKNPGKYSKRLFNVLSNLSQEEAGLFNKISNFVLRKGNNSFIIANTEILNNFEITLDQIILLEEAGLINSDSLNMKCNVVEYKDYLVNFNNDNPKLDVYFLTKCGSELEMIINNKINLDYLVKIKQRYNIKEMNYSIIKSKEVVGDKITYSSYDFKNID